MKLHISLIAALILLQSCFSQGTKNDIEEPPVKNIILMIGDGMGVSYVFAAYTANQGELNMIKAHATGFSKTSSANNYITDSGASGTAMATGHKTKNRVIGVDSTGAAKKTILELAEEKGLSTGLIATSSITHATPASFIAHQPSRYLQCKIAKDFVNSGVDIFIGGGQTYFEDSLENISVQLRAKDYSIVYALEDIDPNATNNIGCLVAKNALPRISEGRGGYLPEAAKIGLKKLSRNDKGFFIMIEGSQIDWGGHQNDIDYVLSGTNDFDKAVGNAFEFADNNPGTLVIVTADHETGGLTLTNGDISTGELAAHFSSKGHTPVMVPVFAYGTGAIEFTGVYENTELFNKIVKLLSLSN